MSGEIRKVGFFIVGAQKSGTTALDFYMRQHPEVCMAVRKEVHFFDNEKYFTETRANYNFYHSFFEPGPQHKVMGETTPAYMYWLPATRRLWEYNQNAKLIIILRNPIDRAFSHWNMQRQQGIEPRSFWEAIHSEHEKCRESLPLQNKPYSYLDRGFYTEQIRRLHHFFPKQELLILKNEELRGRPKESLDIIWEFLGVAGLKEIEPVAKHTTPYCISMSEKERVYLYGIFEYEIRQLERMLGWDCSDWLIEH